MKEDFYMPHIYGKVSTTRTTSSKSENALFSLKKRLRENTTRVRVSWGLRIYQIIISAGARESVAADRLVSARPTKRPASTTYRDSRPGVGVATGARNMRDGVTGSACSEKTTSRMALGLDSTEDGYQMEKVISLSPCRSFD